MFPVEDARPLLWGMVIDASPDLIDVISFEHMFVTTG